MRSQRRCALLSAGAGFISASCPRRAGLSPGLSERCAGAAARSGVARAAMGAAARERQPGGSLMNAPCSCGAQSEGETEKRCDLLPPSRGS